MRLRLAALLVLAGMAACGSARSRPPGENTSRKVLVPADFAAANAQGVGNVYELINRLRPEWLMGEQVGPQRVLPSVWVDRQRMGGVSALATMPLAGVAEVRYLTPMEARGELGMGNQGGAIVMTTIRS